MTTAINLGGREDAPRALDLMQRYHDEAGLPYDDDHRAAVVQPLLDGSPLGAIWLIGPTRAPLGYVMMTFGWSVTHGGMVAWLSEAYIRNSVRNRGIGTEVMHAIAVSLRGAGVRALHASTTDDQAMKFCARVGFAPTAGQLMTDVL